MRIEVYIIELLYTHDCVIIPDFGAFLTKRESAFIDTDLHQIEPPKRSLQFSAQIKNHDGLLAKHIAFKQQVTFQKAEAKIKFFVEDLRTALHEGKNVHLQGIGTFLYDEQISFQPEKNQNFLLESFGLEKITLDTFQQEPSETPDSTPKVKSIQPTQTSRTSQYLKYAAVGFIGLGITAALGLGYYENQVETYNVAEQQKAEKALQEEIQAASFSLKSAFQPIVVNESSADATAEENAASENNTIHQYHIIAGAFRVKANAYKKIKQLNKQDYQATYVGENRYHLHQIAYASFDQKADAIVFLRQIRAENPAAWLLVE